VTDRVAIVVDPALAAYDFGPGHPLSPIRVELALRLAADFGLLANPAAELLDAIPPLGVHDLERTHLPRFVAAVMEAGRSGDPGHARWGLGTPDVPVFPGMHEAASLIVSASLAAVRAVHEGRAGHAVNLFGGLHHAMSDRASGFCVYNDVAVGIQWLLDNGVERIAYLDLDAHHGDGVESVFLDDPRVLTLSIHESGRTLFPGSGWPGDVGGPAARGFAVNLALPAGTADNGWLRAFNAVAPPLLAAFRPEFVVSQHGCDSHRDDSLANLMLSVDCQRISYRAVHRMAHRLAGGRWVAVGGGGYEWVDVVPRAWTHLIAEALHAPIPPTAALPRSFQAHVRETLGCVAPALMTDGEDPWGKPFERGFDERDPLDEAILATRRAVFPHWGLSPDPFDVT
jgi:acetoin utilization protein AcuC